MPKRRRAEKALRAVDLFSHCSSRELADIAAVGYEKSFSQGARLTQEGVPGESLFVILDGAVEVEAGGVPVGRRGASEFVGEIALVSHSTRTATVTAATPVTAYVIPGRAFRSLLGRQPELHRKVLEALAARVPAAAGPREERPGA